MAKNTLDKQDSKKIPANLVGMKFDPLASVDKSAVLNYFPEEQGVLLEVAERYVEKALTESTGDCFVDPGCGSAILSLAVAKKFERDFRKSIQKVYAIDINKKAIKYAKSNVLKNGFSDIYSFACEPYEIESVPKNSAMLISHNVPYHPTHPKYEGRVFTSCGGGEGGQKLLREFLRVSSFHLAPRGVLYGIVNCRGGEDPEFFDYIRDFYPTDSIYWYPIHDPCSTREFLSHITRGQEPEWVEKIAKDYPKNHVGIYVIVRDCDGGKISVKKEKLKLATAGWQWRFNAHRIIQDQAIQAT